MSEKQKKTASSGSPAVSSKGMHCRIFEESARLGGKFTLRDTGICVDDILNDTRQYGKPYVLTKYRDQNITERDIDLCRTIAAHHIPDSTEFKRNGSGADTKILLDENMPHRIIPKIMNESGRLSHISFHSLTTHSDPVIWKFAKEKDFHAIITNDDDFIKMVEMEVLRRLQETGCFEKSANNAHLPLVVFIAPEISGMKLTEKVCRKHIQTISGMASETDRKPAYAVIDQHGLKPGLSTEDIYYKHMYASLKGAKVSRPVFDRAIMDHHGINCLMQKCGWPLMKFTQEQSWQDFYRQKASRAPKANDNKPPPPKALWRM